MDGTADPSPSDRSAHRPWLSVPTGLLAVAAGVLIVVGSYRPTLDGQHSLRQLTAWPDPDLLLGLAVAVGAFGLLAMLGRTVLARLGLGGLVLPGLMLVMLTSGLLLEVRRRQPDLLGSLRHHLGGELVVLGLGLALLAALLASGQIAAGTVRGRGGAAAVLATLGGAGLLHSVLAGSITGPRDDPTRLGYLHLFTTPGDLGWGLLVLVVGLAWMLTALGLASGRRGAPASGLALGAAVALGIDLAVRLVRDAHAMTVLGGPGDPLHRRVLPLAVLAGAVLAYLLVAVLVRGRPASAGAGLPAEQPVPGPAGYRSSGDTGAGTGRTYEFSDQPTTLRPLVDERAAHRPWPRRPSHPSTASWPPWRSGAE
jgi:hypothetical protein